jgi:hypothetical protein
MPRPPMSPQVVCSSFLVVRQDRVSRNEQPIALNAQRVWEFGHGRRGVASVWVVQLYKSIEAPFRVPVAASEAQDLVRRRRLMGLYWLWPMKI